MRVFRVARWFLPALMLLLVPAASYAGVSITVNVGPPLLPVYEQPICPEEGWMWIPGYWAYGDDGYYWVPGEWVPAPYVGALWTPPWWGWDSGRYVFHDGYWGDRVGYYGGINYGFGYMGVGFVGGEWRNGAFAYNTAVMRVNRTVIHNTYVNQTIVRNNTIVNDRRVAFNGGPNGVRHDPTPVERQAMSSRHTSATAAQVQHMQAARTDRMSYAKANGGHPRTPAVTRPASEGRTSSTTATAGRETTRTPENHTAPAARAESRTATPHAETRGAPTRTESRSGAETRSAPSRTESGSSTAREETRTEPRAPTAEKPRAESRAPIAPRTEPRLAPESHAEARPAPAPRAESHPAPPRTEPHPTESRPAESHPAPQHESRPAPAVQPVPQHAAHPAPPPKQEKPKPEPR